MTANKITIDIPEGYEDSGVYFRVDRFGKEYIHIDLKKKENDKTTNKQG